MESNEELSFDEPEEPEGLSMLPVIFTNFSGVSSSPTVSPVDDVERIQTMINNIEQQQMAVRMNILALLGRRQKILENEMERIVDDEPEKVETVPGSPEMLFKANISATVPKDHEIGKDDLVKGNNVARYDEYEIKIEDLPDLKTAPRISKLSWQRSMGDGDGDIEMGGMDPGSKAPKPSIPRTRAELGDEIMSLVERGRQELEEFDEVAKQEVDKLKSWLEKKRGKDSGKETADIVEKKRGKFGGTTPTDNFVSREKVSYEQLARRG